MKQLVSVLNFGWSDSYSDLCCVRLLLWKLKFNSGMHGFDAADTEIYTAGIGLNVGATNFQFGT